MGMYIRTCFQNKNPVDILLLILFCYPIIMGFLFKYSSKDLKNDLKKIESNISFIIALILGIYWMKNIFFDHSNKIYTEIYNKIPKIILKYVNDKPFIIYLIIIPLAILIIYNILTVILEAINHITLYPIFDVVEKGLRNKNGLLKRVTGALFKLPKSICYIFIVSFILNYLSIFNISDNFNNYLQKSKCYNSVCQHVIIPVTNSNIAKKIPNIIDNSFKISVKRHVLDNENDTNKDADVNENLDNNTIIYYNGITLDEGVKSNSQIDAVAVNLVKNCDNDRQKSKLIYNWIVKNIDYDTKKAEYIYMNNYSRNSGAIETYNTRKGICFDYACLFVAMCRANNIDVRMVTGKGFNGASWVSHAWNQVFIREDNLWVNVDTTFGKGGDYFDSRRFMIDHKEASIAGEWK